MTIQTYILSLFLTTVFVVNMTNQDFYKALYSTSLTTIESTLTKIESDKKSTTKDAYKGALLMKKSDFMKTASQKIELFKEGHQLLEAAIKSASQNAEYRFIRLTIQENAPKILKYNKNIEEDKVLVINEFKKMNSQLQTYILDYAAQSTVLKKEELKK